MKWIKRIFLSLLLLIVLAVGGFFFWLNSSSPDYSGEQNIPGLQSKVDIYYDEYGIPHISGENTEDVYRALGYVHAQDRLFQMELMRRAGSGRLAEIIGPKVKKIDVLFRLIGLVPYAQKSAQEFEALKGQTIYSYTQAYLDGVNHYINTGPTPPEFSLIGIEKQPFEITDLFYITGAMSFSFSQAQKTDPVVHAIASKYGSQHLKDLALWHGDEESFIRSTPPVKVDSIFSKTTYEESFEELSAALESIRTELPFAPLEGSNSWVVSGSKTKSGQVIFCNDTHIGYALPQTWYEAHLSSPDFELYGHFLAGVPFALVGRNKQLSWGLTMLLNDDMDFYKEKRNPENPEEVWYVDHWEKMESYPEVIKMKGASDTIIQVRRSRHGFIVNGVFEKVESAEPLSMMWSYTQIQNRTVEAFFGMNHSQNMATFSSYLPLIHSPGLNMNYGDNQGNVAWWACAQLVKRPAHVNSWTLLDGSSGNDEPLGYYSFKENPKCINPQWGYIYSANDWPAPMSDQVWYPGYYLPQHRANRIRQLLEDKDDWTVETIQSVMTDHKNLADSALHSHLMNEINDSLHVSLSSLEMSQLSEVAYWDGKYTPKSFEATFYTRFLFNFMQLTCEDELGKELYPLFTQTHQFLRAYYPLFHNKSAVWYDDVNTDQKESRHDIILKTLSKTLSDLTTEFGQNPKAWNWRKVCSLEKKHPLGEVAVFRPVFNIGPEEVTGGSETIMQQGIKWDSTGHYKVIFGSQMRIIFDFADVEHGVNVTPSGQSGHIMSEHYADQHDKFMSGEFRPMLMNWEEIKKINRHLVLQPQ